MRVFSVKFSQGDRQYQTLEGQDGVGCAVLQSASLKGIVIQFTADLVTGSY